MNRPDELRQPFAGGVDGGMQCEVLRRDSNRLNLNDDLPTDLGDLVESVARHAELIGAYRFARKT
ncbi:MULTISPECIES: hypothetical protein [unclassified Brevibacterium]|uniref:hypothetical protein n=1 Tax=unclassified Brevibacterium TaxID=2614124 RepID=UPI001E367D49|nr:MULTISPECIES: hypothetical protein [unclassified Brevibacterium]MDK8435470.1 hypothetical protein [Brevibacterium sp. H-BE7]